jgi:hypothetical protein
MRRAQFGDTIYRGEDAGPRRTSWFDMPRGSRVANAVLRFGVAVWATAIICALMAMAIGGSWLLVALVRTI